MKRRKGGAKGLPPAIPMNHTVYQAMGFILAIFLFLTALAYTFWSMNSWPEAYELVPSSATVFIEESEIPEEALWTGSQIVAKLYQLSGEDRIPIVVDGYMFATEDDFNNQLNRIGLSNKYVNKIILNEDGEVERLVFTKDV